MSRIFFKNNPYPNGHKIKEFIWSGRLKKDKGLLFDFHLVSDDYYAEDDSELDDEEEKKARLAIKNSMGKLSQLYDVFNLLEWKRRFGC